MKMGLTISSLFSRLFGKKQMRILMGEYNPIARIAILASLAIVSGRGHV